MADELLRAEANLQVCREAMNTARAEYIKAKAEATTCRHEYRDSVIAYDVAKTIRDDIKMERLARRERA